MRAVVCQELGGLDGLTLGELPRPKAGAGEVLIEVTAAGLNFADLLMIKDEYQEKPDLPFAPGLEIAGRIVRLGDGVSGFSEGQRVMATVSHGGFAEYAVARGDEVVALPDGVDDVTAAGFAIAYGTAYGALQWATRLGSGETLVVHGAAGGVGLATVECGRALGANVIGTARGAARLEVVRAHGADHVIDTSSEDVREKIKELTSGRGADVVFDPIGGDLFEASLRSIAWGGRLLVIGFAGGRVQQIPANILLVKNVSAIGFYWGSYRKHDPARVRAGFSTLLEWASEGRIKPHVSMTFELSRYREALEALEARKSTGKIVLTID
ncbi:MAG: NADPH:quinone oxidoreductase family protein [Alphaproteobacteria bacterium]|nr:NADPH:quinone oxidoreductase family protein [Alphaproteobacteria bacterium]